jgi:integrase
VVAAAVRPEFRSLAVYGHPGDPVLFGPACPVAGCVHRQRGGHGLCAAHGRQYRKRGNGLDVAAWLVLAGEQGGPRQLTTLRALEACGVGGCGRSVWNAGLCRSHHQRWRMAGYPALADYRACTPVGFRDSPAQPAGSCAVADCRFARLPRGRLCDGHQRRFDDRRRRKGYTLERYLDELAHPGRPRYDLAGLPRALRAELQFGLQCMADERSTRLRVEVFNDAVARLRERGYQSLLDAVPEIFPRVAPRTVPFLRFVSDRLDRLADAQAGRQEWDREVWRTDRLPGLTAAARRGPATLSFTFCRAGWLRALIKRWVRWRLGCGLGLSATGWNLRGLRLFVEFCQSTGRPLHGPGDITRVLLEDWLAYLLAAPVQIGTRNRWLGSLRLFLDDVRRHEWAPGLAASATYHPRELARQPHRAPRFLDEQIITRLERDDALDLLPDLTTRTLVLTLIETGLRAIDARTLPPDCLSTDAAGAPYLRYFNHKLARERFLPISPRLAEQLHRQQAWVRERFPGEDACLLPRERQNPDGRHPYSYDTLVQRLHAWVTGLNLRDANGQPVRVTPHRFRHTLATRMINAGVPEIAVQQMLDHNSPQMTSVYARLHDQTLREHFDRFQQRVNIRGEPVLTPADQALADAAWAKENLARAKQTLPNGFCGLPLQQTCPHPNACLTCDHFLTTSEFLPVHREQLDRTRELLADARERGQQRLVDINEPVELNLVRIIDGLHRVADDRSEEIIDAA